MLIGVQWTLATPGDWEWFDIAPGVAARVWELLPKKPKTKSPRIDGNRGWPMAMNIQGVTFEGYDCYVVRLHSLLPDALIVTGWTEDYPGSNFAIEVTFQPPAPDSLFGGRMNTRQSMRVWAEPGAARPDALPWSQFVRPPETLVRYGVQVSDALLAQHRAVQSQRGWRDWIEV